MSSTPASHTPEEPLSPVDSNDGEDLGPPQTSAFLRHVSEKARVSHCVSLDHLYSRPWGWRSDGSTALQTRLLLVSPPATSCRQIGGSHIDVEAVDEPVNLTEPDEAAAQSAMDECQQHVAAAARDVPDDLIDQLDQSSWNPARRQLLRRVLAALNAYQLARRAVQGLRGAAFAARVHADRCTARVRRALAAAGWQRPLCQWLHTLLLQKLGSDMLALYLEVLQTLTSKVPSLAGRLSSAVSAARHGPLSAETLVPLLRRPWDPAAHIISQHKMKRLPNNPLLVLVPSSPCDGSEGGRGTSRQDFWHRQLAAIGRVVPINMFQGEAPPRGISVSESLSHILAMSRQQISEQRRAGRPLVLVGWGAAGLVAAHLALVEPVAAVVALGFPCWSPAGRRGEPDDPLTELRTPTLLLVGQAATDAAPHQLEMMRERMPAQTGLVVVGGADSRLLVSGRKRQREGLTQTMVDRAIMEEISEFLVGVLTEQTDGRRPQAPPQQRDDALMKSLARQRRKKSTQAAPQPVKRRTDRTAKPARSQSARWPSGPAQSEPTPTPTPSATDGDDSLSEPPIIDLIPDGDAELPEPEPEPEPQPEPGPTVVSVVSRPAPVVPPTALKVFTTPPFKPQTASLYRSRPAVPVPAGPPTDRGARHTRAGRLKVTHKLDSGPTTRRNRGRGRARLPRYGVAREFGTPASMLPARFTAPVCAAAAGRARPAVERGQQLVYVQPQSGRPAGAPVGPERLLVLPAGGGAVSRQVLVSRGRARTVTYVPASRAAEHQYAAGPGRYMGPRPAGYPRLGRPQMAETARHRPPPPAID